MSQLPAAVADFQDRGSPVTFTVLITTYNRQQLLGRAVDSALAQTYPCQVVVVDDASTDGTEAYMTQRVADLQAQGHQRLVYHRHGVNQGHARSVNGGVALAQGSWIKFLDDDDYLADTCIETLTQAIAQHPTAVICSVVAAQVNLQGQELSRTSHPGRVPRFYIPQGDIHYGMLLEQIPFGTPAQVAVERQAFQKTQGWKPALDTNFDDIDSWVAVAQFGDAVFIQDCLAYRTVWPGGLNQTFSFQTRFQTHLAIKETIYGLVSDRHQPPIPPFRVIRQYLQLHWAIAALQAKQWSSAWALARPALGSWAAWRLLIRIRRQRGQHPRATPTPQTSPRETGFHIQKIPF